MHASSEAQLEQLSADSKDPHLAQEMVSQQVPDQLMRLLAHHVTEMVAAGAAAALPPALRNGMLLTLRVVRNLCAVGDAAVKQLLRADAASWLTSSASAILNLQPGEVDLLRANMQALANFVTASPAAAVSIWQPLFPSAFSHIINSHAEVHELAGCIAYRCVQATEVAHRDLLSPEGDRMLQSMLMHAPQGQSQLWLQLLLVESCIVHGRLEQVRDGLAAESEALQLHLICEELESRENLTISSSAAAQQLSRTLMELLGHAAAAATSAAVDHPHVESHAGALEDVMKVIRDLSGIDPREGRGSEVDALSMMCQEGLVTTLLGMLRALPPITKPSAGPAAAPAGMAPSAYPSHVPYQGYRSDIVAVLANAAFGRPPVREQISRAAGVELLLEQCQIDDANPLVKEWALWGVRNLSASPAVRHTIEQLQAQGVAPSDVLREAGYEANLNHDTKRPRLVRASKDDRHDRV